MIGDHNKNQRFPLNLQLNRAMPGFDMDTQGVGTPAEQKVIDSVVGPEMGVPADRRTGSDHPDGRAPAPRRAGEPEMKILDKKTSLDTVRLAIFVVVTTVATALLAVTIGNISFNATTKYRAVFTDAIGLNKGDDVRIAGVKVGQVDKIALVPGHPRRW